MRLDFLRGRLGPPVNLTSMVKEIGPWKGGCLDDSSQAQVYVIVSSCVDVTHCYTSVVLCYVMFCYVTLRYAVLSYVLLCCVIYVVLVSAYVNVHSASLFYLSNLTFL